MSFQPGGNLYSANAGSRPETVEVPHVDTRAPAATDILYPVGKRWINTAGNSEYTLTSQSVSSGVTQSTWTQMGQSAGSLNTLTGDSGGAISPSGNNINVLGTANQITTTGSGSTITLSLPAVITAPGSLTTTTTLASGTTLTAGSSMSATTSITAGTTITATLGAITATNGNLVLGTAGNKLSIATGANASCGKSSAMTAGTITISTTAVTASSLIFLTCAVAGGTPGVLEVGTIVAGTSFVINSSSNTDTSQVNWLIIN